MLAATIGVCAATQEEVKGRRRFELERRGRGAGGAWGSTVVGDGRRRDRQRSKARPTPVVGYGGDGHAVRAHEKRRERGGWPTV